jgi:hypothetical protein
VTFASVDNRADKEVLLRTWNVAIPTEYYVDIQDLYEKVFKMKKRGMAPMAAELIDPWYEDMKKKLHWRAHNMWEKNPLNWDNLKYAAIDGFVSLELYRVLKPMAAAVEPSISNVSGAGTSSSSESSDVSSRANKRRRLI